MKAEGLRCRRAQAGKCSSATAGRRAMLQTDEQTSCGVRVLPAACRRPHFVLPFLDHTQRAVRAASFHSQ